MKSNNAGVGTGKFGASWGATWSHGSSGRGGRASDCKWRRTVNLQEKRKGNLRKEIKFEDKTSCNTGRKTKRQADRQED